MTQSCDQGAGNTWVPHPPAGNATGNSGNQQADDHRESNWAVTTVACTTVSTEWTRVLSTVQKPHTALFNGNVLAIPGYKHRPCEGLLQLAKRPAPPPGCTSGVDPIVPESNLWNAAPGTALWVP